MSSHTRGLTDEKKATILHPRIYALQSLKGQTRLADRRSHAVSPGSTSTSQAEFHSEAEGIIEIIIADKGWIGGKTPSVFFWECLEGFD